MDTPPSTPGPAKWFDSAGLRGAVIVGVFGALLALMRQVNEPGWATDLDQLYYAAQAMRSGANPYDVVGPGRQFDWPWPLYYPLPAVLLTLPLTLFPLPVARVLFTGLGAAIFGYAITRNGTYWRLPFVLGAAFLVCAYWVQWSLFLTAAFFLPLAAIFLLAKPNIAVAFVAGIRTRHQAVVITLAGITTLLLALVVFPDWIGNWVAALRTKEYVSAPIMNPGGFLLLLALLRWKRPEARVFAVLVAMPQTPSFYDMVPLAVIPRNLREMSILSSLTTILFWVSVARGPYTSFNDFTHSLERIAVWIVYLPALIMMLRRPNRFDDPPESVVARQSFREHIESLPRLDFLLLVLNAAFAVTFIWGFLVTRRG